LLKPECKCKRAISVRARHMPPPPPRGTLPGRCQPPLIVRCAHAWHGHPRGASNALYPPTHYQQQNALAGHWQLRSAPSRRQSRSPVATHGLGCTHLICMREHGPCSPQSHVFRQWRKPLCCQNKNIARPRWDLHPQSFGDAERRQRKCMPARSRTRFYSATRSNAAAI
jgi:hypothetical protein